MTRFSLVVAFALFGLGTIVGYSMISPASGPAVANERSLSIYDLQRNAPTLLPVQRYDAV
jgi:hypothetical protein